jgi:hypothetical protein
MIPVSTRPSDARSLAFSAAAPALKIRTATNFLTKFFVFVFFAAALPAAASATCLSILNENGVTYWVNHCSVPVSVNWNDQGDCTHWNCSDGVGPNSRETTDVKGDVKWCECQGDECLVFGPPPCKASFAEPDDQQSQDVGELKQHLLDEEKKSSISDQKRLEAEEELQAEEQDNIRRYNEIQATREREQSEQQRRTPPPVALPQRSELPSCSGRITGHYQGRPVTYDQCIASYEHNWCGDHDIQACYRGAVAHGGPCLPIPCRNTPYQ